MIPQELMHGAIGFVIALLAQHFGLMPLRRNPMEATTDPLTTRIRRVVQDILRENARNAGQDEKFRPE